MTTVAQMGIVELLAACRRELARLTPTETAVAVRGGGRLVDIRADDQIRRDGIVPGALVIGRNVLEWRLDPASPWRHPDAPESSDLVVLLCDEGYSSSLAAVTLQTLGLSRATDVIGGFRAWRAAGMPVEAPVATSADAG